MYLKSLELSGFKSFAKKSELEFASTIAAIVGPNGSGKSNIAEAFRFVLGEQSFKSMRTKRGEDLIWGGSQSVPRANRASVKVLFDNAPHGGSRLFDIDFDEVSIERVVHRDGVNQYLINGSQVRLKDVAELLAGANVGSTGHHIISQGEADRLLSATIRERREMIEDALGLKIFQYKKKESERKLEQTTENIGHVMSLRKEIEPHLKFLKRQVEKIEKTQQLREELRELLRDYLKREEIYLKHRKAEIAKQKEEPSRKLNQLEIELREAREVLEKASGIDGRGKEVLEAEQELSNVRKERDELSRELGRLEGQIAFAEKHTAVISEEAVPYSEVRVLADNIEAAVIEADRSDTLEEVKSALQKIKALMASFLERSAKSKTESDTTNLEELKREKELLDEKLRVASEKENECAERYKKIQEEIEGAKDESRDAERNVFRITAEKSEVEGKLRDLRRDEEMLAQLEADLKSNLEEGAVLAGREVLQYASVQLSEESILSEARSEQEKRRKDIERIKIRVEEAGGGSSEEILKEYNEANERDQFLEKEIADLEKSAETLKQLILELDEKLAERFHDGITKINKEFQHFFSLLFGGGTAALTILEQKKKKRVADEDLLTDEEAMEAEEAAEEGIDISVSLPRKKIKGLQMLSGGERALTSIALLFAMSQVNPPPFLILDETEAALDEANSRKYGAMIKDLSKKTQLILITHNRETMSVAGVLYGVTMGSDGISKLLSVKFEEAVQVAK